MDCNFGSCGGCSCHINSPCFHCLDHLDANGDLMAICDICDNHIRTELRSDDSGVYHEICYRKHERESALAAGIPESVVDGKTKLSDHFSQEYIDHKRGAL